MTVFVKALSDLVALLLQALRLSVLLPAAVLVGLNLAFVLPLFEGTQLYHILNSEAASFPLAIVVLVSVLLVAYALAVANIPIIRFFEGYPWLEFPFTLVGRFFRSLNIRHINYMQRRIEELDHDSRKFENEAVRACDRAEANRLRAKARQCEFERNLLSAELAWYYPHHQSWRVLPTRLGNVIAAAEEYSGHLYGLDAVTFWPYLTPILTEKGYAPFVEREKAALDFLLNMAVVTLAFGAEIVYVDWLLSRLNLQTATLKLLITGTVVLCFYMLSIQGALSWGYTIRTAFVLYRHTLCEKLRLHRPNEFYEERIIWQDASRFYHDHDVTPGRQLFDYLAPSETKSSKSARS